MKKTKLEISKDLAELFNEDSSEDVIFKLIDYIYLELRKSEEDFIEDRDENRKKDAIINILNFKVRDLNNKVRELEKNKRAISEENKILMNKNLELHDNIKKLEKVIKIQDTSMDVAIQNLEVGKMKKHGDIELPF